MKIRPLSRSDEKRLLACILRHLDGQPPDSLWTRVKREICMIMVGVIAALVIIIAATGPGWMALLIAGGAFFVGLSIGIFAWHMMGQAQWPAVAKCIDRGLVEARLQELDA